MFVKDFGGEHVVGSITIAMDGISNQAMIPIF
jgi:hypothetical protein